MNWVCPICRGEFPELDEGKCPWCGTPADGTVERSLLTGNILSPAAVDEEAEEEPDNLLTRLLKG